MLDSTVSVLTDPYRSEHMPCIIIIERILLASLSIRFI